MLLKITQTIAQNKLFLGDNFFGTLEKNTMPGIEWVLRKYFPKKLLDYFM